MPPAPTGDPACCSSASTTPGRSQMAAGYLTHLRRPVEVRSAGRRRPIGERGAVAAMAEEGIDIAAEVPKVLTTEAVKESRRGHHHGVRRHLPDLPGKRPRTGSSRTRPARGSRPYGRSVTRSGAASRCCSASSAWRRRCRRPAPSRREGVVGGVEGVVSALPRLAPRAPRAAPSSCSTSTAPSGTPSRSSSPPTAMRLARCRAEGRRARGPLVDRPAAAGSAGGAVPRARPRDAAGLPRVEPRQPRRPDPPGRGHRALLADLAAAGARLGVVSSKKAETVPRPARARPRRRDPPRGRPGPDHPAQAASGAPPVCRAAPGRARAGVCLHRRCHRGPRGRPLRGHGRDRSHLGCRPEGAAGGARPRWRSSTTPTACASCCCRPRRPRRGHGLLAVHGFSDESLHALGKAILRYSEDRLKLDPVPLDRPRARRSSTGSPGRPSHPTAWAASRP